MKFLLFVLGALNFYTEAMKLHHLTPGIEHQKSLLEEHQDGEAEVQKNQFVKERKIRKEDKVNPEADQQMKDFLAALEALNPPKQEKEQGDQSEETKPEESATESTSETVTKPTSTVESTPKQTSEPAAEPTPQPAAEPTTQPAAESTAESSSKQSPESANNQNPEPETDSTSEQAVKTPQ